MNTEPSLLLLFQTCTLISCLISTFVILGHLFYYNERNLQKYIIRILFAIPVYSLSTLGAYANPEHVLLWGAIRDFYESYVLYTFMQLLIQYLGGQKALQIHFEFKVSPISTNHSCLILYSSL